MKEFGLPEQRPPDELESIPMQELAWQDQPICSSDELVASLAQARQTLPCPLAEHPAEAQAELIIMNEFLRLTEEQ